MLCASHTLSVSENDNIICVKIEVTEGFERLRFVTRFVLGWNVKCPTRDLMVGRH